MEKPPSRPGRGFVPPQVTLQYSNPLVERQRTRRWRKLRIHNAVHRLGNVLATLVMAAAVLLYLAFRLRFLLRFGLRH